jgi:hypothetical protein
MEKSNYEAIFSSLLFILENPFAEKGYEDLKSHYLAMGMEKEAEAMELILREKFNADSTNSNQE